MLLPAPEEPILPATTEVIVKEEMLPAKAGAASLPGSPAAAPRWPGQAANQPVDIDITVQAPGVTVEVPVSGSVPTLPASSPSSSLPARAAKSEGAPPITKGKEFKIQLGAFKEMHIAEREKKRLLARSKALLRGSTLSITKVDLKNKGVFYRIQAGGFASAKAAEGKCQEFKKSNIPCIVVAP